MPVVDVVPSNDSVTEDSAGDRQVPIPVQLPPAASIEAMWSQCFPFSKPSWPRFMNRYFQDFVLPLPQWNFAVNSLLSHCKLCKESGNIGLVVGSIISTSNFSRHMERSHKDIWLQYCADHPDAVTPRKTKQASIASFLPNTNVFSNEDKTKAKMALVTMLAVDNVPPSIVKKQGFLDYSKV